jgi:hypothetical protein
MAALLRLAFASWIAWASGWSGSWQGDRGKPNGADVHSKIAGTWRGSSVCVVKDSPCHDEMNVYRFSSLAGRLDFFAGTAGKVVDGKEINMGSGTWKFDAEKRMLECERPSIRLVVDGDKMEGALRLEDGTVYRRIYLKKEK